MVFLLKKVNKFVLLKYNIGQFTYNNIGDEMRLNILFKPHVSAQRLFNNYNNYHGSQNKMTGLLLVVIVCRFTFISAMHRHRYQNALHLLELYSDHNTTAFKLFFMTELRRVWHSKRPKKLFLNFLFLFRVIFSKIIKSFEKKKSC